MSNRSIQLTPDLYQYLLDNSLREPELLKELRQETAKMPQANMQIAPEQGQFMALLIKLLGAVKTIEVGVFTGYSALATALALPENGKILGCDISEEYTAIAARYWRRAGVSDKIQLHIAPAAETLAARIEAGEGSSYDFAFIDADKESYRQYYELCLELLRPGGLIVVDNVLWNGAVIDTTIADKDTLAIRTFNDVLHKDERVDISLIAVGDGLTLVRKR